MAIGYNEIGGDVLAYLDDVDLTTDGSLTLEATSDGEIGGVAVGVAVARGATASSQAPARILINMITNKIEAYDPRHRHRHRRSRVTAPWSTWAAT